MLLETPTNHVDVAHAAIVDLVTVDASTAVLSLARTRNAPVDATRVETITGNRTIACQCLDCGAAFVAQRSTASFCSIACRSAFNNRRKARGAELYDLFMMLRYERGIAKYRHLWTIACNLARAYRDSDNALRSGRSSWDSTAVDRLALSYGARGDNR